MSIMMRILLIAGSLLTAFYVLRRVRKSKMRTEDSVFWLVFSLILVLMGLLPNLVTRLASWMGVISAANLVFLIVIFSADYQALSDGSADFSPAAPDNGDGTGCGDSEAGETG